MVGVTSPLFRNGEYRRGLTFVGWYVVGTALAAGAILGVVRVASAGAANAPAGARYLVLAVFLGLLLVLDLAGRTPHLRRQTPRRLAALPPSVRGLVWGLDIGLLVTTIKVTSLVWALLLVLVVDPTHALLDLAVFYGCFLVIEGFMAALDVKLGPVRVFTALQQPSFTRYARYGSVVLLALVFLATVSQVPT